MEKAVVENYRFTRSDATPRRSVVSAVAVHQSIIYNNIILLVNMSIVAVVRPKH